MHKRTWIMIAFALSFGFSGYTNESKISKIIYCSESYSECSVGDILFKLDDMTLKSPSTSIGEVNWFIIPAETNEGIKKEILSLLLTAKTTGVNVLVGFHANYDSANKTLGVGKLTIP